MGLFQPQCREAKALLLAWLLASLRSSRPAYIAALPMSALGQKQTFDPRTAMSAKCHKRKLLQPWAPTHFPNLWLANEKSPGSLRGGLSFQKSTICPGSAADWCAQARIELR
jgi:hypothetical protein